MLKSDHLRMRVSNGVLCPAYVREDNYEVRKRGGAVLEVFRKCVGKTRGELKVRTEVFSKGKGDKRINRALVELLLERCEFEAVSDVPVVEMRRALFEAGAAQFPVGVVRDGSRLGILESVGRDFGLTADQVEQLMFSDLKEEQKLQEFKDMEPLELVRRYNVALAQGALLQSSGMRLRLKSAEAQRLRQLFRFLKFFRLLFTVQYAGEEVVVDVDGPLSVVEQTRAYGVRLASFLPALLLLDDYALEADARWKRKRCVFHLAPEEGLVSHYRDTGSWVPSEMEQLVTRLRQLSGALVQVKQPSAVYSLGGRAVYVPDISLVRGRHKALVEVIWPWRRLRWKEHYELFREHAPAGALLVVSLKSVGRATATGVKDPRVVFYRVTPPADQILKAAGQFLEPGLL